MPTDREDHGWNPWHGCTKISPGCLHCYVYRTDEAHGGARQSFLCQKNQTFDLPVKKGRDGAYKIPSGSVVYTCFTSDFLLKDADEWRPDCWNMIRERSDCLFYFFTKRIDRFRECMPPDWGDGYPNVMVGCTVENQDRADFRLPIFLELPIRYKTVIAAPLLERINLEKYLTGDVREVSVGGESGEGARPLDYDWVLDLRRQCEKHQVSFTFHQTGANFIKDGRTYQVRRSIQRAQARKAGIQYVGKAEEIPLDAFPDDPAEPEDERLWLDL